MGQTIIASPRQTDVPLSLMVTRDGGITGLTVVVRIFDTANPGFFLDFNDGIFKAAGHTTPTRTLPEVSAANAPGLYSVLEDFSAVTFGTATTVEAHYDITAGGEAGNDVDLIMLDPFGVRDSVWNAILQGNTYNINNSAGRILRQLREGEGFFDEGTLQAGAAASATLRAGASPDDDLYNGAFISLVSGPGAGQARVIVDYDGTSKVATVFPGWVGTLPTAATDYVVTGHAGAILVSDALSVVSDAVLDENLFTHTTAGSVGRYIIGAGGASAGINVLLDGGPGAANALYDANNQLVTGRLRFFDTDANMDAATPGNVALEAGEAFTALVGAGDTTFTLGSLVAVPVVLEQLLRRST